MNRVKGPSGFIRRGSNTMRTGLNTALDPTRRSGDALDFENALRRKIVGQDAAVEKVVEIYQMFLAGLNPPGRPGGFNRSEEHTSELQSHSFISYAVFC